MFPYELVWEVFASPPTWPGDRLAEWPFGHFPIPLPPQRVEVDALPFYFWVLTIYLPTFIMS